MVKGAKKKKLHSNDEESKWEINDKEVNEK